jgi:hypothetical protein
MKVRFDDRLWGTIQIPWSGEGFGEILISVEDGYLIIKDECIGRVAVKEVLKAMVDQAKFVEWEW